MSDYHPNLDGPAEPIGLKMASDEAKERSELASATGYALLLACPDCGADKWKECPSGNECCVCAEIYHRHNIYSTSYLLGYHRGLKAHNAEIRRPGPDAPESNPRRQPGSPASNS